MKILVDDEEMDVGKLESKSGEAFYSVEIVLCGEEGGRSGNFSLVSGGWLDAMDSRVTMWYSWFSWFGWSS